MFGLYHLWYKKYPRSRFHFFNDNKEWLNMDKIGHATTAYISSVQYDAMRWCGAGNRQAALTGGLTSLGIMTLIEVLDGFSKNWGFSKGDMLANISGSLLFTLQQYVWQQQKFQLRFSYHSTIFPKYNPEELGSNFVQKILKDYNGQTYWLSVNIPAFLPTKTSFPKWINLSAGYGASGMTGASSNPTNINGKLIPPFKRKRQYYFSINPTLVNIQTSYSIIAGFKAVNNIIQIPSPVIEIEKKCHPRLYYLYF
jgi:hypothetical protein